MFANPLAADLDHILDHTRPFWDDLRGERLFITGGTGFFGCWLLESFLWANDRLKLDASVTVLTRRPEAFIAKTPHLALADAVTLLDGDIRTYTFPAGTFSHVIHAAGESSAKLKNDDLLTMLDIIIDGTRNTLEEAVQHGCQKWLLTSSGAIYGPNKLGLSRLTENAPRHEYPAPPDFRSVYCQGKRMAEYLGEIYYQLGKLNPVTARCFAFMGPYLPLDSHFAAGNFINDILDRRPVTINGDGTPLRSYLYGADLAIWLWTLLFRGKPGVSYNVGSDQAISIAELAHLMVETLDPTLELRIFGKPIPGSLPESYVPEINLARETLGLEVRVSLAESIRRTYQWHRS
jgi:nucleoside-diphosphate-sugar epimerase